MKRFLVLLAMISYFVLGYTEQANYYAIKKSNESWSDWIPINLNITLVSNNLHIGDKVISLEYIVSQSPNSIIFYSSGKLVRIVFEQYNIKIYIDYCNITYLFNIPRNE